MGEPQGFEHQLEHCLQGHFHPDVAPRVRREIRLGTVSMEGFIRLAELFQANHQALDGDAVTGVLDGMPQLERTEAAQLDFEHRMTEL